MYYNCHIHTFKDSDIPDNYLPLGLVRLLAKNSSFRIISKILNNLNPFSDNDTFDRYVKFCETGRLGSQAKIFENCLKYHDGDFSHFVVLSMDMAYMGSGPVPRPYMEQLEELAQLPASYPQVMPFVHIDPRRKGYLDILYKCIEEWNYKGVKIYPPLGYFPYDERLYPVYDYCTKNNLPVFSHCSPYNPVHFKGKYDELYKLLEKSKVPIDVKGKDRKELCSNFTHPRNWEYVIHDFPSIRLCLAHFGSAYYWEKYLENPHDKKNWLWVISDMIATHPNVFADISFTMYNPDFYPVLKKMLANPTINRKILFGSDYYMVETETSEGSFANKLRKKIGEDDFATLALTNPRLFFLDSVGGAPQPQV